MQRMKEIIPGRKLSVCESPQQERPWGIPETERRLMRLEHRELEGESGMSLGFQCSDHHDCGRH